MTDATDTDPAHDERRAKRFEQVVVAISVVLTLALLGYATWQVVATPAAATPRASVETTQAQPDGSVRVTVALSNPQDSGLERATVETRCGGTTVSLEYQYVPARDTRMAYAVCPPGTDRPSASLSSWVE